MSAVEQTSSKRLPRIDGLRGIALFAMASFHLTWDLHFFDLIDADPVTAPVLVWYARGIAASFLMLVGVSLVLAHRGGLKRVPFLRRLVLVAGAALAVTLGTYFAFPDSYVFFGTLHHIAVASVLALPFQRLPLAAVVVAALFCFAAPALLTSPVMSHPALLWLGLSPFPVRTNDFVPLFPWFGWVLTGLVAGRALLASGPAQNRLAPAPTTSVGRGINFLGRHSLAVYLIHQPVLIGLVWLIVQSGVVAPRAQPKEEFGPACVASCRATGEDPGLCMRVCGCIVGELKGTSILAPRRNALSRKEQDQMDRAISACRIADEKSAR